MAHRKTNKMVAAAAHRAYLEKIAESQQSVRIYTDASYNNQKKVGAIAYIIIDGKKAIEHSESVVGKSSSTFLELLAVHTALNAAQSRFATKRKFKVISDCKSVVDCINDNGRFKKKLSRFHVLIDDVCQNYSIECEHTRAHTHRHSVDSEHNRRVDMLARRQMKNEVRRRKSASHQYDNITVVSPTTSQCSAL